MTKQTIIYTITDEAPALATYSFLPIVQKFAAQAEVEVETKDISLASRVLAQFSDRLSADQQHQDALAELGELAKTPEANIIKLPNISASVPQLNAAIKELQEKGYDIPDYPEEAETAEQKDIQSRYAKVLGSAVNPVLREGNSDRRVAAAVKAYAKQNPHRLGEISADSKTHVAHMDANDFYGSEQSYVMPAADEVRIEHVDEAGEVTVMKSGLQMQAKEVIDSSRMSKAALRKFFSKEIKEAKKSGVLLSLHLKATMMKVSDPIMFGHAVEVYYEDVFKKHADLFAELGVEVDNGIGNVYNKIQDLPKAKQAEIEADIAAVYESQPALAMVDSDKGITNLHVPNNVIIDASMPAAIKSSAKMWNADGQLQDTKAIIPDRSYAGIYQEIIEYCQEHGAFDVVTMGNVCNVGLMAQKAEEYGSHDKTFEIEKAGMMRVVNSSGEILMQHDVEVGDIWRACQTKDLPIRDWVKLAVTRARNTGDAAIFWLDENRAHDRNLIEKVETYLADHDTTDLEIKIMNPRAAMRYTCERVTAGLNTISVTGNVLRDYLTDLFPILELGTSAKMLSIVPLLAGGGLFETGAGGSAPKHVQQFVEEGHLRWDSLGEFLALAVSLEDIAEKTNNTQAKILAEALDDANERYLSHNKSPSRKVNELDNRGSQYYLAKYWAKALSRQDDDAALKAKFTEVFNLLQGNEASILDELLAAQGAAVEIGGYYEPNDQMAEAAMRPSDTLNNIINSL
ncbi:NADP-dependent isocitrate dehydrogenase [Marinicella sp. S1101]|uniref:NADP-dependent isocitrate dehydrogenase n=1 Tax=Marinicella marina TaxID=2996016 RepID=UPI002260A8FE|nr:NADP-dependent isocitrate dehydrogenase [Marinicella marina]MCX7553873.1 NADP-dependent isocitrate dehydrogenase [Marinicella marina]MDJ1140365.1 NADP-dependent isocitrate dehydrogenase [Marinicella marina]